MKHRFFTALALAALCPVASARAASSADHAQPGQVAALELYRAAIGYRTSIGQGQVPALAARFRDTLVAAGFPAADIEIVPVTNSLGDRTAALIARYRGDGSSGAAPILFLAHMDVVEARPEEWKRDPFTLTEENGYFFGRGTEDDKLGAVALVSTFARLKQEGFTPDRDLVLAFSGDEETAMETTKVLAARLKGAAFALNADAGGGDLDEGGTAISYGLQAAEKTYATFRLTVRNPGGHSSLPRPDNAIYELAGALKNIEAHAFPVRTDEITLGYFKARGGIEGGETGAAMRAFAENPKDPAAAAALAAKPELVGLTRTTCVAVRLAAGHADNALPQTATATINCRVFPGVPLAQVQAALVEAAGTKGLEVELVDKGTESPPSPLRDDVLAAVAKAVHAKHPGVPVIPSMSAGATDGAEFRAVGVPTYGVLGLFTRASDEFSHGLDERIPVSALYDELDHWRSIVLGLAGPRAADGPAQGP